MIELIVTLVVVPAIIYILYINGIIPISVKSAVMYISGSRCKKATFTSCSGYVKRVIKLKGDRRYDFVLSTELTNGTMSAEIVDNKKNTLITLDANNGYGSIYAENGTRYTLYLRFQSASGSYELEWK